MHKLLLTLMLAALFISACEKNDSYTEGELTAKEIQNFVANEHIEFVTIVINDRIVVNKKSFAFKGQYIIVDDEYFNLNYVIHFVSYTEYQVKILQLDFIQS